MKIISNQTLRKFKFWYGGYDTREYLKGDELDIIEVMLEGLYPDGMDEADLNDFFWYEDDTIAEWLGYDSFEEIMERAKQ